MRISLMLAGLLTAHAALAQPKPAEPTPFAANTP